jgi:hypothetical protein
MKHLISLFLFLAFAANASSQTSSGFTTVDWKNIKNIAAERPDSIKGLVARMTSDNPAPALSAEESVLAFYGQSILSDANEEPLLAKLFAGKKKPKIEKAAEIYKKSLEINPLNIEAMNSYMQIMLAELSAGNADPAKSADVRRMSAVLGRIFNTILSTGDGTEEHPFYVTRVNDEYTFMEQCLGLDRSKLGMQGVSYDDGKPRDYFVLKGKSEKFDGKKIFFDITRVLETERKMFGATK